MAQTFAYRTSEDTLNGAVSAAKLDKEIRAALGIRIELVGVTTQGDSIKIDFKADVDADQEAALDDVVGAHDGVPLLRKPLIDVRSDGALRIVQEPSNKANLLQVKGFAFTVTSPTDGEEAPTESFCDLAPDVPYDIQGVQALWVIGDKQHADDYVQFAVVFPTGAAQADWEALKGAPPWPFAPSPTSPMDVKLKSFADNVYVPPGGLAPVIADGTQTIAPPLVLRLSYFAHEVSPVSPLLVRGNIRWWRFQT
jgi:hypothetical protein